MKAFLIWFGVLALIGLVAIAPVLYAGTAPEGQHEGNSARVASGWLFLVTMPAGAVAAGVWTLGGLIYAFIRWRSGRSEPTP